MSTDVLTSAEVTYLAAVRAASLRRYREAPIGDGLKAARLTREQAKRVFDIRWRIRAIDPELEMLIDMVADIERDCAKGLRCSVCFGVDDPDCVLGC